MVRGSYIFSDKETPEKKLVQSQITRGENIANKNNILPSLIVLKKHLALINKSCIIRDHIRHV